MSLKSLAPIFLPLSQSSSDPLPPLCNSTAMSLPLAQLFCGMPPQIVPSQAPSINQHVPDGTTLFPLPQQTNQFKSTATANQPTPAPSAPLSLQHQAHSLLAIHKTIQQFNQHLKAEHLDRQTLQLLVHQLQNDFALLRYLLFSDKDITTKDSATTPLLNPNPNPNHNTISSDSLLSGPSERKLLLSTPVGAVGPLRTKINHTANTDFQPIPNTQEASPTAMQNLTSRICKLEKLLADEISA